MSLHYRNTVELQLDIYLAGAALHILNKDSGEQYIKLISGVKDIILNTVPEFAMNYIDALMLP